jgi:hypothetical protein
MRAAAAGGYSETKGGEGGEPPAPPRVPPAQRGRLMVMLPDHMVIEMLGYLDGYSLGRCMCVCRLWRALAATDVVLWRPLCHGAVAAQPEHSREAIKRRARGAETWRGAYRLIPALRSGGMYVMSQCYVRRGVADAFSGSFGLQNVRARTCTRVRASSLLCWVYETVLHVVCCSCSCLHACTCVLCVRLLVAAVVVPEVVVEVVVVWWRWRVCVCVGGGGGASRGGASRCVASRSR